MSKMRCGLCLRWRSLEQMSKEEVTVSATANQGRRVRPVRLMICRECAECRKEAK